MKLRFSCLFVYSFIHLFVFLFIHSSVYLFIYSVDSDSLVENRNSNVSRQRSVAASSRRSSESSPLPPCGDSFFEKSPPVLQRNTPWQLLNQTKNHSLDTTPTWREQKTEFETGGRPDIIDLSGEDEDVSFSTWNDPRISSTPNAPPRITDPPKFGTVNDVSFGLSRGKIASASKTCDRSVTLAKKSFEKKRATSESSKRTFVKKIGNSLPDDGYRSKLYKETSLMKPQILGGFCSSICFHV